MYKLKRFYNFFRHDIPNLISNIIYFSKILLQIRWWDGNFGLQLFQRHVQLMADNWHDNHYEGGGSDTVEIKTYNKILLKYINDDYLSDEWKYHCDKWRDIEIIRENIKNSNLINLKVTCNNIKTEDDKIKESEECGELMNLENKLKENDREYIRNNFWKIVDMWD